MVIVAGKTVDFHGIAGFLIGLKADIVSIQYCKDDLTLTLPTKSCMYLMLHLQHT